MGWDTGIDLDYISTRRFAMLRADVFEKSMLRLYALEEDHRKFYREECLPCFGFQHSLFYRPR